MSTYIYYKYFKPAEQEQITSKMAPNSSSPALLKRNNSAKQLYGNNKKVNPELLPIVTMSYNLALYYIPYHLRCRCEQNSLKGLPKDYIVPPEQPPELYMRVADFSYSVEKRFASFFKQVPSYTKVKNGNAKQIFIALCRQVLNADVNWGRLISIYTLGGAFAVHFVNTGQKDLVKDIPFWIKEVIETTEDVAQWINKKGGWVRTFVYYCLLSCQKGIFREEML